MPFDKRKFTKKLKDKYSFKDETFKRVHKSDWKDLVELEVGDSKTPTKFIPQHKIMRWQNECNVSIRLKDDGNEPETVETREDKIVWKKGKREAHFYDFTNTDHPEGAQELEIVLLEKPATNVVEFTLQDKDVEYFYQAPLTPEEIAEGASRPENVVGSYAVYAKTQKTNWVGGKEYKVGKVGHIYRPRIEDSNGNWTWGELHIENGILSVTIPQEFLDTAVYPVKHAAGLTFGYTSNGATNYYIASYNGDNNERVGYTVGPTSEVGTLVSMSLYGLTDAGVTETVTTSVLINKKDDPSVGQHGLLLRLEQDNAYTTTPTWFTFNASSQSIPIDTYVFNVLADGADVVTAGKVINARYDTAGGTTAYFDNAVANYATMSTEDPWTPTQSGTAKQISIYATYTASGGGGSPTPTLMLMGMGT